MSGERAYNEREIAAGRLTAAHVGHLLNLASAAGVISDDKLGLVEVGARAFQRRHGLTVDGKAGPKTQAALDRILGAHTPAPQPSGIRLIQRFPVAWLAGMVPTDVDGDLADLNAAGRVCPGYDRSAAAAGIVRASERPVTYGGGFTAARYVTKNGVRRRYDHAALDVMAPEGALVRVPNDGEVVPWRHSNGARMPGAGSSERGGNYLRVRDRLGVEDYFSHLREVPRRMLVLVKNGVPELIEAGVPLKDGDTLHAGEYVGFVGRTGNAVRRYRVRKPDGTVGPVLRGCTHCHWSVTDARGVKLDPGAIGRELYDAGDWSRP